jgi:hypothetical protein
MRLWTVGDADTRAGCVMDPRVVIACISLTFAVSAFALAVWSICRLSQEKAMRDQRARDAYYAAARNLCDAALAMLAESARNRSRRRGA